jgi:hypothetical protein
LRDARFTASASGEGFRCGFLLWCAAWHQVPAASIPDDDIELAQLAGFGRAISEWLKVRDEALQGWVMCSDGRWYHPVVAEKALEAWESRLQHQYEKMQERIRKGNKRRAERGLTPVDIPEFKQWNSGGRVDPAPPERAEFPPERAEFPPERAEFPPEVTRTDVGIPPENALKGQGEGQGQGEKREKTTAAAAEHGEVTPPPPPPPPPFGDPIDPIDPDWSVAIRTSDEPGEPTPEGRITALLIGWERSAGRQMRVSPSQQEVRGWVAGRVTPAELRQAYDEAVQALKAKPRGFPLTAAYLGTVIARLRAEAAAPARGIGPAGGRPPAAAWERDTSTMLAEAARIGLVVDGGWTADELAYRIRQRLRTAGATA